MTKIKWTRTVTRKAQDVNPDLRLFLYNTILKRNPKFRARNPKQIRNPDGRSLKQHVFIADISVIHSNGFDFRSFENVMDFDIRVSEFLILTPCV